jgi:protease I
MRLNVSECLPLVARRTDGSHPFINRTKPSNRFIMKKDLSGKKVAILVTNGFEDREFRQPLGELRGAAAQVRVITLEDRKIKGWSDGNWTAPVEADILIADASVDDFDALVLPGGVMNPDALRQNEAAVKFVRGFFEAGKPVGAICHAPWLLIEADVVRGRRLTSYGSIKTDLINAGAKWEDAETVVDQGLVTSRKPDDLDAFCRKLIEEVAEGVHSGQHA